MQCKILVLYCSRHGSVKAIAQKIAQGIEAEHCEAVLRTVEPLSNDDAVEKAQSADPVVTNNDLKHCDGLALGSPVRFGNMAAEMKAFWDTTTPEWITGSLSEKPAAVFTSSASMHGGNEVTLLTMMLPLFHHGMILLGTPYTEPDLTKTTTGGSPYGVTHVTGLSHSNILSNEENSLSIATGKRLAKTALALKGK